MATLAALAGGFDRPAAVLTTVNAATPAGAGARGAGGRRASSPRSAARVDVAALRGYLARMGYGQAPTVTEPGEFAVRGGLIDLWPPGARAPVRLDLFGDVLDSARRSTPRRSGPPRRVKRVELAPVSEVILDEAAIQRFRTRYRAMFGAAGHDDPLYEAVSAGRKQQGYEHWLPFFHERLETLFDYLPGARGAARRPGRARRGRRAGRRSPTSTTRGRRRSPRSRSSGRSTSRCRRPSSTSTTPAGRRRWPGGRCTSSACCRSRSGRGSSTPAGGSGATSRPSGSRSG